MPAFPPFNRLRQCRYGTMVYNPHDLYIGRSLELYGEFSESEVSVFRQFLRPGMVVVEVGANIGAHTVFLAQTVGPGGRVLAFEPQRLAFQALCANLALNSIPNVDGRQAGVGAAPGELFVPVLDPHRDANFGGAELGGLAGERVPVVTLDSLGLPWCHLLKIDVEGMEDEVLRGATATVARCRPLLYVENDRPHKSAALIRAIDALGYRMHWHRAPLFNPNNFARNEQNVFGGLVSPNMLCCPKEASCRVDGFSPVEVPLA